MHRRHVLTAVLAGGLLAVGAPITARADAPAVGADVSKSQCAAPWSGTQAFAIVAVNDGVPIRTNSCLGPELALAATSPGIGQPAVSVYVNTANPSPSEASWWPTGDRTRRGVTVTTPYGRCTGGATTACSYVYGASLALDDLQIRGVPAGAAARWWLDVETANTWRGGTARHRAVLEGMTDRLVKAKQKVGLYALTGEFRDLIGTVPKTSPLTALPSWIAGAGDQPAAARNCSVAPLTTGRVLLAQWTVVQGSDHLDLDLACTAISPAPKPSIAGAHHVGARLTAKPGTWAPGVHLAYTWTRDGTPIAGATGRTHLLGNADGGHRIAVVVTGTRDGSSRAVRTSRSVSIHR